MIVHAAGLALIKRLRSTLKRSNILEGMPCVNENLKLVSESFALPVPTLYVPPSRNIELLILIFVLIYFSLHEFEPDVERVINYDASFLGPVLVIPPHLPFLGQLPTPYKIPFSSRPNLCLMTSHMSPTFSWSTERVCERNLTKNPIFIAHLRSCSRHWCVLSVDITKNFEDKRHFFYSSSIPAE